MSGHFRVVADNRFPDIPWLIASVQRFIDRFAAKFGVDDISRIGIGVSEVIVKP